MEKKKLATPSMICLLGMAEKDVLVYHGPREILYKETRTVESQTCEGSSQSIASSLVVKEKAFGSGRPHGDGTGGGERPPSQGIGI